MNQLWIRQIGGVLRLELKKNFLSKRGWWIYLLALGPVFVVMIHWLVEGKYLAGLTSALFLWVGSVVVSFLLIGRHFGPRWSDYLWHGPGLSQLGSYALVTALACIGYGAVFLMCGLLFKNPMIAAAVVWVWENLNAFLPSVLKKISVIFYLKNLCPVEVSVPPPFNTMVIEADPTPFWLAVPGLLALSLIFLVYAGLTARQTEINYGE